MRRELAEKVNVDATGSLLAAAEKQPSQPRFVLASSIAVYGARNPHTLPDVLTADTPLNPADVYGAHKVGGRRAGPRVHAGLGDPAPRRRADRRPRGRT